MRHDGQETDLYCLVLCAVVQLAEPLSHLVVNSRVLVRLSLQVFHSRRHPLQSCGQFCVSLSQSGVGRSEHTNYNYILDENISEKEKNIK